MVIEIEGSLTFGTKIKMCTHPEDIKIRIRSTAKLEKKNVFSFLELQFLSIRTKNEKYGYQNEKKTCFLL